MRRGFRNHFSSPRAPRPKLRCIADLATGWLEHLSHPCHFLHHEGVRGFRPSGLGHPAACSLTPQACYLLCIYALHVHAAWHL